MLGVIREMRLAGHELVVHASDRGSGLRSIIALHSTLRGPALGGVRFLPYPTEQAALTDVLSLSEGMSLKAAAAGLKLGGGKSVIIGSPNRLTDRMLRAFGDTVEALGGRYIAAEDVGTSTDDLTTVAQRTKWVAGLPQSVGGSGNSAPFTARGVVAAMRAVSEFLWNDPSLESRRIAIQGVGKVGASLAAMLADQRAELFIADTNPAVADRVGQETGAVVVPTEDILWLECEILAPCALGGVLRGDMIAGLRCAAIVGSANNQLDHDGVADILASRSILYAPDFIANAGGLINIGFEFDPLGYDQDRAALAVERIQDRMSTILEQSSGRQTSPHRIAKSLAHEALSGSEAS